ncbi:MAG: hypothetical protein UY35_C0018G0025 [Candidatus Saccharibacteria bacterium GW2011_GWC2_48_9]|nr:MAG: hypothetical protein UY35_C0018G0025 [Candidatus Saccharibacteria bacterium GW2011_GWC2_48_9]HCH34428.1 hypothetical protein [Candidatus Saccharibacteria bacterium]
MTKSPESLSYVAAYPSLMEGDDAILSQKLIDQQREYYEQHKNQFADMLEDSTAAIKLSGDEHFRAVALTGENSDETIVIGGEFGNGRTLASFTRAMGIRAVLSPEASLVLLPNNTLGENNLNLSGRERLRLRNGRALPYSDRYRRALDYIDASESRLHIVGMSLGATTGAAFARTSDIDLGSATLVESPLLSGSPLSVAKDFLTSGAQLSQNIEISQQNIEDFDAIAGDGFAGFARFGAGALSPSNIAALELMRNRDTADDINGLIAKHEHAGVVTAWGTKANVSPRADNQRIASLHADNPWFQGVEIKGADHSVTNAHAVVAALALRAKQLSSH